MPNSGIRHIDVGPDLTKAEFESPNTHEVAHGTTFPPSPFVRQLFYRSDENRFYFWNGTAWTWLGGGAMSVHGNEMHSPAFAPDAALLAHELLANPHAATPLATANRLVLRDAAGIAKFAAPAAAGDPLILGTPITDTEHGSRAAALHADSHPRSHDHSLAADGTPIAVAAVPGLPASRITSERFPIARIPDGPSGHLLTAQGPGVDSVFAPPPPGGAGDLYALGRFLRPGRYHVFATGSHTPVSIPANTLLATPFFTPVARTVTRIAIHVTLVATGNARLGIYQDDDSVYPGLLLLDAGTVSVATVGIKEITGLTLTLSPTVLHWLVIVSDVAPGIIHTTAATSWSPLGLPLTGLNATGANHLSVAFPFGSLPATFPPDAAYLNAPAPRIALFFS